MGVNEKIVEFLSGAGCFYFSTVEGDQPRVRPFGFAMIINDKLYFGMGDHKRSYKQLQENPKCELCACKNGEWIRVSGKAHFDLSVNDYIFEKSPFAKAKYGEGTPLTHAAFYLDDMHCEYGSMSRPDNDFEYWC